MNMNKRYKDLPFMENVVIIENDLCKLTQKEYDELQKCLGNLCGSFDYFSALAMNRAISKIHRKCRILVPNFRNEEWFEKFNLNHRKKQIIESNDDLPF